MKKVKCEKCHAHHLPTLTCLQAWQADHARQKKVRGSFNVGGVRYRHYPIYYYRGIKKDLAKSQDLSGPVRELSKEEIEAVRRRLERTT